MLHKHHKIPKHSGGSDDPENIVYLTPEEHAEAHKKLYEETIEKLRAPKSQEHKEALAESLRNYHKTKVKK